MKAMKESHKDNPNPDQMSYEELLELEEKMGKVSKGFTPEQIDMIPSSLCVYGKDKLG